MVPPCLFYRESSGYRIVPTQGVLNVSAHSDSRNENGRNKKFLDNAFPEVNITISISEDTARMFNWIDKKTQLLTSKGRHGCPRRLRPPALELFCTQSSLGKIDKEEPWTLEIIS